MGFLCKVAVIGEITADNDYGNHPDYAKSSSNSLRVPGWLAVSLGFVEIAVGTVIYGQRWFGSISDGASFYGTAYILPFVLGINN